MKTLGIVLIIIGVIMGIYALSVSVSVWNGESKKQEQKEPPPLKDLMKKVVGGNYLVTTSI